MGKRRPAAALGLGLLAVLLGPAGANAAIPPSLHSDPSCSPVDPGPGADVRKCDDGVPNAGGLFPNLAGAAAVTVPSKYGGDGYTGLPPKAADAAAMPGSNPAGDVALDVDVTVPQTAPPAGGYPLLVFMHGCCSGNRTSWEANSVDAGGEKWHYSNAWFASRGYVVITYTARGFVNNQNRGSTGQTQLDSRRFEINDYQHLACQVLGNASSWDDIVPGPEPVTIDPQRVVATGGSYGGGFSWLALTDPAWTCTADTGAGGTAMGLAAAAPKYGWSDLAYTLVPNGLHSQAPGELPATDGCSSGPRRLDASPCPGGGSPVGVPKTSIISGLYGTGQLPATDHTTFTPEITEAFACLESAYPLEQNPSCARVLASTLPEFLRDRSAYYQNDFFAGLAANTVDPVPIFNAATFTDPLFPAYENRRMINRLLAVEPGYPIRNYFGDYQHFVQNKAKEWGDLCDSGDQRGRHVCEASDYPGGDLDATPAGLLRTGVTTRLNEFIDHYAQPTENPSEPQPPFDFTASLQVCPENAQSLGVPGDEPGPTFVEPSFEALAPNTLSGDFPGAQQTTHKVPANPHAVDADPFANLLSNGGRCPAHGDVAGPGIASYTSDPLPSNFTMIGSTEATVDFELTGSSEGLHLNARFYDLLPNGTAVMVDRGTRRITATEAAAGRVTLQLHGNGWRFPGGHRLRIELAQDDQPFVRATDVPSSLELSGVRIAVPVREQSASIGGGPDAKPRCGNRISGSKRRDRLSGTQYGDRLEGRGGRDRLRALAGQDCLDGGAGRDRVFGGKDADQAGGAGGRDRIKGGKDGDRLRGGKGGDRIKGGHGDDKLMGGKGGDRINARDGERDHVACGGGRRDRATVDRKDRVRGCELVRIADRRR